MSFKPTANAADPPADAEQLRAELADLRSRLVAVETLLQTVYGPECLGRPAPVLPDPSPGAAAAPEPRNSRLIASIGPFFTGT
jgi:hypothetical protein